jgi:hypothetical protein
MSICSTNSRIGLMVAHTSEYALSAAATLCPLLARVTRRHGRPCGHTRRRRCRRPARSAEVDDADLNGGNLD